MVLWWARLAFRDYPGSRTNRPDAPASQPGSACAPGNKERILKEVTMLRKLFAIEFVAFGALIAAGVPIEPAMAAALSEAAMNVPCSGVWKLNEDLTRRTRSPAGPFYQFFEPWGKEGWM